MLAGLPMNVLTNVRADEAFCQFPVLHDFSVRRIARSENVLDVWDCFQKLAIILGHDHVQCRCPLVEDGFKGDTTSKKAWLISDGIACIASNPSM